MSTSKTAVVLMTALVPTIGHEALMRFAAELVGVHGWVDVIVSGRSFEPVPLEDRFAALNEAARRIAPDGRIGVWCHNDDKAPQNPATDEEWEYWRRVTTHGGTGKFDYFVASEPYGKKMAELIGAEFVPFDIDRQLLPVKGSWVRDDIDSQFYAVLPEFKPFIRRTVTIFGQESVGKTTLTKDLGSYYGHHIHEFARPYLELMDDPTVTEEKMETVMRGQYALQKTSAWDASYITIQDTDLLSTIGYYRIMGIESHPDIIDLFLETKSDLYIVCPDNIPFVPDPLRYGGDVRESTMQFWIELLEEFNCSYVVLESEYEDDRVIECGAILDRHMERWTAPIRDFLRE